MITLYKAVDPFDDILMRYVGCYVLKWGEVDQPSVGFVPVEGIQELIEAARQTVDNPVRNIHLLRDALERIEQEAA